MMILQNRIYDDVVKWRNNGYKSNFSEVKEILNFQKTEVKNQYKYLRKAQFEAIETYLFLRFVKQTPKIVDLYKEYFNIPSEFCNSLGITDISSQSVNTLDKILEAIHKKENQEKYKYHSLAETLSLNYPSYILALAMGSGKTNIISAIVAIEFAIAIANEKTTQDFKFMQNALVFAPGLTILKNSLKGVSALPFDKVLPPEICKKFLANVKYLNANNSKELNIISGSKWNVVLLNTEKFVLRVNNKETLFNQVFNQKQEEKKLEANHRLQKIKSMPNLGIFSDEAHHTYGNKIGEKLKKVRETINHIHENKEIVCVINTTGTPYADKKMLKDVVFWYGLEDGIKDGILKSLYNGIKEYSLAGMENQESVVFDIIDDFFKKYQTNEKIAFYFQSEEHLENLKPHIEQALFAKGLSRDIILKYTLETKNKQTESDFLSLDDPKNKKRILLLIGMGKEGWDCKTLFATALISEGSSSNNYILQASTRCLRQIDGNTKSARIYLSNKNADILNKELQANYGITSYTLNMQSPQDVMNSKDLVVKKENPPKLEIKTLERQIIKDTENPFVLKLTKPQMDSQVIIKHTSNLSNNQVLKTFEIQQIQNSNTISIFLAANIIATKYHLTNLEVLTELQRVYQDATIPQNHIDDLCRQIDISKKNYKEITSEIVRCLAIIKTQEGFKKSNDGGYYYHTIRYKHNPDTSPFYYNNKRNFAESATDEANKYSKSFHYEPYNFDSSAEHAFFDWIIKNIEEDKQAAESVEDVYFIGGFTTPDKTDLHFQYKGQDGRYHTYYPDFLIRKKNGQVYIIEVKGIHNEDVAAKEKAMNEISKINGDKIKYCIVYSSFSESFAEMDDTYTKRITRENWEDIINFIKS